MVAPVVVPGSAVVPVVGAAVSPALPLPSVPEVVLPVTAVVASVPVAEVVGVRRNCSNAAARSNWSRRAWPLRLSCCHRLWFTRVCYSAKSGVTGLRCSPRSRCPQGCLGVSG